MTSHLPPQPGEPAGQFPDPRFAQGPGGMPPGAGWPPQGYGAPQPPRSRLGLWLGLGALGLVLALVAVLGFVSPGFFLPAKGQPAAAAPSSPTDDPTSAAQTSTARTPAAGQPAVSIPSQRAPLPKRSTPLPDPATCTFPPNSPGSSTKKATAPAAGPVPAANTVTVTLKTSAGDIGMTLDRALAPCTVANFLSLAQQGYYDSTSCHRLGTTGLQMLQCGDAGGDGRGGPGYSIPDEVFPELKYGRGILAMAKTSAPNSGGSQFFLVYGEAELPPKYTVFGSISDAGLEVLDKVAKAGLDLTSGPGDGTGKPNLAVTFSAVTVS